MEFLGFSKFYIPNFFQTAYMERLWLGSPYLLHVSEIAFVLLSKFKLCNNFLYKGFQILSNLVEKHSLLVHHSQTWISLQRKGYQSRYVTCSVFADTAACRNWDFPQNEYIPHGSIPSVIRNDPGWRWDWINPGMLLHQVVISSNDSPLLCLPCTLELVPSNFFINVISCLSF